MPSVLERYPFLMVHDDDTEDMVQLKEYWQRVMEMPKPERTLHFAREKLESEEWHLNLLSSSIGTDNQLIEQMEHIAATQLRRYTYASKELKSPDATPELIEDMTAVVTQALELAELAAEGIAGLKDSKRQTFSEIKSQRERVQWARKQVTEMANSLLTSTTTEQSKSSSL